MRSILIVEDDADLGKVLCEQLTAIGFNVFLCPNKKSFESIKIHDYSAAILDLNLPDGSGFDILKKISIPAILMTALNTPENRLQGIELGAHDFVPKPFLFKEIQIKLERLLLQQSREIRLSETLVVDLVSRTIESAQQTFFLNDKEYRILQYLIDRSPTVVSRDEILDHLHGDESASHRSIDNVIVKLRQMLMDESHNYIKSVRGVGYQWTGGKA